MHQLNPSRSSPLQSIAATSLIAATFTPGLYNHSHESAGESSQDSTPITGREIPSLPYSEHRQQYYTSQYFQLISDAKEIVSLSDCRVKLKLADGSTTVGYEEMIERLGLDRSQRDGVMLSSLRFELLTFNEAPLMLADIKFREPQRIREVDIDLKASLQFATALFQVVNESGINNLKFQVSFSMCPKTSSEEDVIIITDVKSRAHWKLEGGAFVTEVGSFRATVNNETLTINNVSSSNPATEPMMRMEKEGL